jgi:putative ABC transport system substrate-binding protein
MKRRNFMAIVAHTAFTIPVLAVAQESAKLPRIGVLMGGTPTAEAERLGAFRESLMRLGHIEGRTIHLDVHYAEGVPDRLGRMAREMVDRNPTVIVCVGGQETRALQAATRAIPIVFIQAGDAVKMGLVASFARPGGNTTGFTQMSDELDSKRLELLRELVPSVSRVAFLTDPRLVPRERLESRLARAEAAAQVLGIALRRFDAATPPELTDALPAIETSGSEALWVPNDPLFASERSRIIGFAAAHRLPTVFEQKLPVIQGGLVAYGPDLLENARLAAGYVDKILKGANPADLPVQQPTKFELVINLKTANALGLTIPQSLLQRADEVIE